jgi:hypothetical protein
VGCSCAESQIRDATKWRLDTLRVLEIYETKIGHDKLHTFRVIVHLANTRRALSQYAEAEQLLLQALKGLEIGVPSPFAALGNLRRLGRILPSLLTVSINLMGLNILTPFEP